VALFKPLFIAAAGTLGIGAAVAYRRAPERALDAAIWTARAAARVRLRTARAGDHQLAYLEGGRGDPVVLMHGFGGDKDLWAPLAALLTHRVRVIAPDLPGFGDSDYQPAASYDIASQLDRLAALFDELELDRVHLVGAAMGGQLAGAFAAKHPERVTSLTLLAPDGVTPPNPTHMQRAQQKGELPQVARTREEYDRLLALSSARPMPLPRRMKLALIDRGLARAEINHKIGTDLLENPMPLEPLLADIEAPAAVLWGFDDRIADPSGLDVFREKLPHARTLGLESCGHMPMLERPIETAKHVLGLVLAQPEARAAS
jgi:abhydrolase domain-containing protein 6